MTGSGEGERLRERLRAALTDAMRARDVAAISALRSAIGAIDNAEAVDVSQAPRAEGGVIAGAVGGLRAGEVPRLELSEGAIEEIVRGEITSRLSAAAGYEGLGRADEAARLRREAAVLSEHVGVG